MGQLLSLDDFTPTRESSAKRDPYWYFTDTRYSDRSFKLENTYPHIVYIHWDHVDGPRYRDEDPSAPGKLRVAIRCWIEAAVDSDVIYTRITRTYWLVSHNTYHESKERIVHDVVHGYYAFHFQRECDAVAFRLRFTESHTGMSDHHVDYANFDGAIFDQPWKAKDFARSFLYK